MPERICRNGPVTGNDAVKNQKAGNMRDLVEDLNILTELTAHREDV